MYPELAQRWALVLASTVIVGLGVHSAVEFHDRYTRPNPFDHPTLGVPKLLEGPFDPTRAGIPAERLPWTLDPSAQWTAQQRAGASHAGVRAVAQSRYPLWSDVISRAEMTADGALVLERQQSLELVVCAQGLVVRQRVE